MNMYLHELRSMRKSTLIWIISLIALAGLYFSVYSSIGTDIEEFKKLLAAYPAPIRAALGINLDYIATIPGFYSMVFSFIVLCAAVQAMIMGSSLLSREARERTADFLLVKPVARQSIVTSKLLAGLTLITVTNAVYYAAAALMAHAVKNGDYSEKVFFLINLSMYLIQIIFLALGMILSMFFKKLRSVLPLSLGMVFGLYILGAVLASGKEEDAARFLSPFRYFDTVYIIKNTGYEVKYLLAGAIAVVLSVLASYIIYIRRDIHSVS